jgi:hypothetical protein
VAIWTFSPESFSFFGCFVGEIRLANRSIPSGRSQKIPALVLRVVTPRGAIPSNPFNPPHPDETSVSVASRGGFLTPLLTGSMLAQTTMEIQGDENVD